ncbi:hypothetical protein Tco_0560635, partial [Tanacetum coccineum]
MAESSSHNTSSPKITSKEEHVTLDKPESVNPFLPATQVEFTFEEIAFTTNNKVALLYPSHRNQEYFKDVLDFISKYCLKEAFTRAPTQYKVYLSEFWYTAKTLEDSKVWVSTPTGGVRGDIGGKTGGLDQISNKDTTILYCLANGVQVDYAKLIWEGLIHKLNKKTEENIIPYPRTSLQYPHEGHLQVDVTVVSKAPKPSSQTEEVPQGKKPRAKNTLRRKQSSKHTSESQTESSKSKTGQSKIETKSSSAKDKSPSHPSPPTLVVGEIHKEEQQAAGGPTSLGDTSEEGAHPQLSSDKTKSTGDGLKTTHTDSGTNEESKTDDISKKIRLEDLSEFLKDTRSAFFTPDSPQDDSIIVTDESEEEEADKEDTRDTSHDVPEDTSKDELEQQKALDKAEIASLKARPSYPDVNQLTTLLVSELKNIQWELSAELQALPVLVSSVKKQLKTLDSLPSLLNKVTKTLK